MYVNEFPGFNRTYSSLLSRSVFPNPETRSDVGKACYLDMKDAYYFPHDTNATNDPKVMLMVSQLGLEGYGIYWTLIEHLREQPGFKSRLDILPALAIRFNSSKEKYTAVVKGYALFVIKDEIFFSLSLVRRMKAVNDKKKKLSDAGKRGNLLP